MKGLQYFIFGCSLGSALMAVWASGKNWEYAVTAAILLFTSLILAMMQESGRYDY